MYNTSNVIHMRKEVKTDYKVVHLSTLILSLRAAYVAACRAISIAPKLKDKKHRSHAMSMYNKIKHELKKYDKGTLSIFETIAYRGVLINKF